VRAAFFCSHLEPSTQGKNVVQLNHPPKFRKPSVAWRRVGADWVLLADRRRFGRVVPDPDYADMWRSLKTRGQLSDMCNLSHAKNAVLVAAEREIEFENRRRCATDPPNCPENEGVFPGSSSLVRQNGRGGHR
jgi:hypothetical protein